MKKLKQHLAILLFFICAHASSQIPQGMNYQAVVRDVSGNIIASSAVGFQFTITDGSGGTTLYQETQSSVTNQFGLVTLNIGSGIPVIGTFSAVDWANVTAWLQVDMDPLGGTAYVNMGTSQLLSIPYALLAGKSLDSKWIVAGNDIYNLNPGNVGIGTALPTSTLEVNGQVTITGGNPGAGKVLTSDAAGLATWENANPQIAFSTYTNFSQTVTSLNSISVIPTIENFDDGNNFSGGVFTTPSDGVYHFDIIVHIYSPSTYTMVNGHELRILVNGNQQHTCTPGIEVRAETLAFSCTEKLIAGDLVTFDLSNGANSDMYVAGDICGFKVY